MLALAGDARFAYEKSPVMHPYHRPPVPLPPKAGLSPLVIVLIIVGGVSVLALGSCVLIGGLVVLGASAEADKQASQPVPPATLAPPPTATTAPTPLDDSDDDPANGANDPAGAANDPSPDDNTSSSSSTSGSPAPTSTSAGGPSWFCTASASVRVCGFAGACTYQMVFGNGASKDRFLASQQAKNACETQARIKGSPTVCPVSCSMR